MPLSIDQTGYAFILNHRRHRLKELLDPRSLDDISHAQSVVFSTESTHIHLSNGKKVPLCPDPPPIVIKNIHQLLTMSDPKLGVRTSVDLRISKGKIEAIGSHLSTENASIIDGRNKLVTPGLIDPHTHPVFAGERSYEFGLKASGASYLDIHKAGGGIYSTVEKTRTASFATLYHNARKNLDRLLHWGVTSCEAKSGYALNIEGERKMLEVIRALDATHPIDLYPSFLGAHSLPVEYKNDRNSYIELITQTMIPQFTNEGLALFCDAYCEDGAFTPEEVRHIFNAAKAHGLKIRLHAEQFTHQGASELAIELGASSIDHLEAISDEAIVALGKSDTVAVLLPGAALSCHCPYPPARKLLDAGAKVALGTDLNPGSSMSASLPLMMSLGCMQMQMSCEEVWQAVTTHAAQSLNINAGRLEVGMPADIAIFNAPDYRYIPYHYGENHIDRVIKAGWLVR